MSFCRFHQVKVLCYPTNALLPFDSVSRKSKIEYFWHACGFYKAVAGATPAFLLSEPESDISGTDIVFGSGNSRGRVLITTEHIKHMLVTEKLTGLYFKETMHNNSLKPTPRSGSNSNVRTRMVFSYFRALATMS
ncbi:hypothetical protein [Dokdonella sp.]|uniref:hypothetical protein n=1 Tax=Dokdonella sp. TaxID=2291710 RepID=UPI003527D859